MLKKLNLNVQTSKNDNIDLLKPLLNKASFIALDYERINELDFIDDIYEELRNILLYDTIGELRPTDLIDTYYNALKGINRYVVNTLGYHGFTSMLSKDVLLSRYEGVVSYSRDLTTAMRFANTDRLEFTSHIVLRKSGEFVNFNKFLDDMSKVNNKFKTLISPYLKEEELWCLHNNEYTLTDFSKLKESESVYSLNQNDVNTLCDKYLNLLENKYNYDSELSWFIEGHILNWCSRRDNDMTHKVISGLHNACVSRNKYLFEGEIYKGIITPNELISNKGVLTSYSRQKDIAYKFIEDESIDLQQKGEINLNEYLVYKEAINALSLDQIINSFEELTSNYTLFEDLEGYLCEEEKIDYDNFKIYKILEEDLYGF